MLPGLVAGSEDHNRGFRRIVRLLVWLVIVPTVLLLAMAILMLVFWEVQLNILFGLLTVTLVGCLVTGGVLSLVFLRREANLSKLQLDFVSKVSHELRTPLTSIRMFVEMLQNEDKSEEETALCLQVLSKETARLSDRIERLLDWGRMEAGRRVYELEQSAAQQVVDEALGAFEVTKLQNPRQKLEVHLPDKLPLMMADRAALADALVNLLTNAAKYAGEDATIRVRASADLRHVKISVEDDGPGIPLREHRRIFQKFYRVDDLLSRDVEGSGLGLAIVEHVAIGHGGHVELASEPGKGSRFTIFVPRVLDPRARARPSDAPEAASEPGLPPQDEAEALAHTHPEAGLVRPGH
ncbi:MAG: two-component sensor histidine kinase [Myxococcales bacterium]|nr:two-component sensor histidine kinase [Myxococcales bacterium]